MADVFLQQVEKTKQHRFLYHYTNVESLKAILRNKSLRASRIDLVNDAEENKRITSLWNTKVFVLCFTYELSNEDYFFNNYGNIRLEFQLSSLNYDDVFQDSELTTKFKTFDDFGRRSQIEHTTTENCSDWCLYDKTLADVFYTDSFDDHIAKDGFEENAGLIKLKKGHDLASENKNWQIESETRLRFAFRHIGIEYYLDKRKNAFQYYRPSFKYVFFKLPTINSISFANVDKNETKGLFDILENYNLKSITKEL